MKTLALLIDGDNAQLSITKQILQFCNVFGTLKIKKAYGDWKKPPLTSQSQKMIELGIELVQQNRVTPNATDFRLAMDVALMLDKSEADIYFIVSSDGHFTAVCEQIHQNGAKVIGIAGSGNASSELRKSCDIFFDLEEIVENLNKLTMSVSLEPNSPITPETSAKSPLKAATVPQLKTSAVLKFLNQPPTKAAVPKAKPKVEVKPKVATTLKITPKSAAKTKVKATPQVTAKLDEAAMLKILINNYKKAPQKEGWVKLAQLGDVRPQLKQKFGAGFANKPISTWFKYFPDKFEVETDRVRLKYTV